MYSGYAIKRDEDVFAVKTPSDATTIRQCATDVAMSRIFAQRRPVTRSESADDTGLFLRGSSLANAIRPFFSADPAFSARIK